MNVNYIKISQILYFCLLMIFLTFLYFFQKWTDIALSSSVLYIYTLLLLPLFDSLFHVLVSKTDIKRSNFKKYIIPIIVFLCGLWILYLFSYFNFIYILALALGVSLYFKWDGKIYFTIAIVVFCYVALFLVAGQNQLAENLSIIAYYLLIAWVLAEWISEILLKEKTEWKISI